MPWEERMKAKGECEACGNWRCPGRCPTTKCLCVCYRDYEDEEDY